MNIRTFLLSIFLLCSSIFAFGQCCSPGNPVGGSTSMGMVGEKQLRTISFYRYSYTDTRYSGSEIIPTAGVDEAWFNYAGAVLSYGISSKLNLETELGYFINKSQHYDLTPDFTKTGKGLSNGVVSIKTPLYKNLGRELELTAGLGVKFPFNRDPQVIDGLELPMDIQPSTMATGIVAQTFLYKGYIKSGWHLFFINRYEQNSANDNGYQFGSALYSSLFVAKVLTSNWTGIIQLRSELKDKDNLNDFVLDFSGGKQVYLAPQINYSIAQKWNVSLSSDIPIYRKVNGEQLANKFAFSLMIIRDFDLSKKNNPFE